MRWRKHEGLRFDDAKELLAYHGLDKEWMANLTIGRLLQVEVAKLGASAEPPYVVLRSSHAGLLDFARRIGLLDFDRPMVLDPIHKDYTTEEVEATMRAVGGRAPSRRRGGR